MDSISPIQNQNNDNIMKDPKVKLYIVISLALGLINSLPTNTLDSFRGISGWIASAVGFMFGGFIIGLILALIASIFNKRLRTRIIYVSTLIMMIILIVITPVNFFGN